MFCKFLENEGIFLSDLVLKDENFKLFDFFFQENRIFVFMKQIVKEDLRNLDFKDNNDIVYVLGDDVFFLLFCFLLFGFLCGSLIYNNEYSDILFFNEFEGQNNDVVIIYEEIQKSDVLDGEIDFLKKEMCRSIFFQLVNEKKGEGKVEVEEMVISGEFLEFFEDVSFVVVVGFSVVFFVVSVLEVFGLCEGFIFFSSDMDG